jgi:hypothetical protein
LPITTTTATTATGLFCSIPAGLAFSGFIEPFGLIEFLLCLSEYKGTTAPTACDFLVHGLIKASSV